MSSSNKKSNTRINAKGEVVSVDSGSAGESTSASLLSTARTLDVFGFNLDIRQFCITLALASIMLGTQGTLALLIALGAYTIFTRVTRRAGSARGSGSSTRRRGGGGGGGGPRVRGIGDLPCDPKVG